MQFSSFLFPGQDIENERSVDYSKVIYIPRNKVFEKETIEDEEQKDGNEQIEFENFHQVPHKSSTSRVSLSCGLLKENKVNSRNELRWNKTVPDC